AAKKQNLLYGNIMAGIRELIEGDRNASAAFSEWFACLRDIWSGDTEKVRLCRGLEAAFLNAADSMPDDRKKPLREQVRAFDALFYPILASKEYRDWKQDDAALVDSIPFVLTYTEHAYMAIPFSADDNNSLFENVAVPTVANPDRIIYLYLLEKEQDMDKLLRAIPHVMQYMSRKRFKAAVEFVLACEKKAQDFADKVDGTEIMKLGEGRIRQVKRIASDNARAIPADIEAYLRKRSAGKRFFAVEKNDTKLSEMLLVAGFYDSFASYRFDSRGMKFDEVVGCDMLRYIRKTPYMTVADMMSLRLSVGDSGHKPEFVKDDYGKLWEKYQENTNSWKFLCTALGEHAEKNDIIAGFKKWQSDKNLETYQYIIPFECSRSAEKIIQSLEEHDIIGKDSYVTGRTTDSCKVTIHGSRGYKGEFGKLFSDVYALMIADDIRVCPNPKDHEVDVKFDSLVVSDAPIDVRQRSLMNYFYEEGYVINLQFGQAENNKVRVSFTYASRQIKELLTTEGKMLEVHTYRKAKELGEFDDVESGYEVSWEGTDVKSEFDCVLTKGFRSLFVECKARPHIDQNFYYKLGQLTGQFGINATAVLVADTQEVDSAPLNDMQRERGNMLGVITVYKRDEIEDIGNTLLRIIDGNYGNKDKDKEERDHG
ncbi:MAG: DUF1887 family protein, partial [Clostridiales bacterium]|nr:DUF1887 family protein [Clostridiales bacterium]